MTEYFYRDELGQYFYDINNIASSSSVPSSGTYYRLNLETGTAINGYSLDEIQDNNYIG